MPVRPTIAFTAGALLLAVAPCLAADLRPAAKAWASPVAVEASLRVTGEVTGEQAAADKAKATPIELEAVLGYTQQGLPASGAGRRVARRCDRIASSLTAETVREDRRLVIARADDAGAVVAAVEGPLRRPEADRLQWAADPLVIEGLLPSDGVREGSTWRIEQRAARRLMGLDTASLAEVTAILTDLNAAHARIRFAGPIHGVNDGAKTEIDVRGVGLFDRRAGRFAQLNLAWSESRELGPATPALKATAKLNLAIRPAQGDELLSADELSRATNASVEERLAFETKDGSWSLLAGRDWFVVGSDRRLTTLRQVGADGAKAQTTIMRRDGGPMTREGLEREVRYSLGDSLDCVVATAEGVTATGLERLSIDSTGQIAGQPTRWRHHQLAGPGGVLVVTTTIPVDGGSADVPAGLVDAIRIHSGETKTADRGKPSRR